MTPICTASSYPNGTPIDSLEGKITGVYDYKNINGKFGPTTVQNATIEDVAGNKLRMSVWGHADMTPMRGMDVVVYGNKEGKGLEIEHRSYKDKNGVDVKAVELKVQKSGQFQKVEIWRSQNGTQPLPPSDAKGSPVNGSVGVPPQPQQVVRGDKVGMACKLAGDLIANKIVLLTPQEAWYETLKRTAQEIIQISTELEQGK